MTYKEFAAECGITTGNLSNYIKRKNVIADGDFIDETLQKNIAFIQKRQRKSDKIEDPAAGVEIKAPKPPKAISQGKNIPSGDKLADKAYKIELEVESVDLEIKKQKARYEKIKADKAEGIVIPTDLVKTLFLQGTKSIFIESKQFLEDFITQITTKHGLSAAQAAEWRKRAIDGLNLSIKNSVQRTKSQLDNIVEEYSLKRGQGEHE